MTHLGDIIFNICIFASVYIQVFLLVTFLENKHKFVIRKEGLKLARYPLITIIIPCWNEEKTVARTVASILGLNYPQENIKILLVDDGSTDNTWNEILKFKDRKNVKVLRKENGGKYTALNLGLQHADTEFVGCLDADSMAHPEALVRLMSYFEQDPLLMSVAPSVLTIRTKNMVQNAQRPEYYLAAFVKKMLGFLGAIHVVPGPLTIFKKEVFDKLGPYRHGHNTEDLEITYRMQKNSFKIEQCHDAYVYTNTPSTLRKLYKQRIRWIYGSINNLIDYRGLLFKKRHGNFSFFTLPSIIVAILSVSYLFGMIVYNAGDYLYSKFMQVKITGIYFSSGHHFFDPFFLNMKAVFFIMILFYFFNLFSMIVGRKMVEGKWYLSVDMLYFFALFGVFTPVWFVKAIFDTVVSRNPSWR